jgi:hypothetical protein
MLLKNVKLIYEFLAGHFEIFTTASDLWYHALAQTASLSYNLNFSCRFNDRSDIYHLFKNIYQLYRQQLPIP